MLGPGRAGAQDCTLSGNRVDFDFDVQIIGTLGGNSALPRDINAHGVVVGDSTVGFGNSRHAFRWSGGQTVGLPAPGSDSNALAINDREEVVGYVRGFDGIHYPAYWNAAGQLTDLRTVIPINSPSIQVSDINNRGEIVGNDYAANPIQPFVFNIDTGGLSFLPAQGVTQATVINDQGVVGGVLDSGTGTITVFTWTRGGGLVDRGTAGKTTQQVYGLNESGVPVGQIILGPPGFQTITYTGGFKGNDELPGLRHPGAGFPIWTRGQANDINKFGEVVGSASNNNPDTNPDSGGFLWYGGGALPINSIIDELDPFTKITALTGINDHGQIIGGGGTGYGFYPFILNPGPSIDAIDPNPDVNRNLVDANGDITTDTQVLASENLETLLGLAADGATPIVLRIRAPSEGIVQVRVQDENGSSSEAGTLSTLGGSEEEDSLFLATEEIDDVHMAFAVLKAPADFPRTSGADAGQETRPLCVLAEWNPIGGNPKTGIAQLDLHRPPVVLIHGLWSSAGTWGWSLQDDTLYRVKAEDYSGTAADFFRNNVVHVRLGRDTAVRQLRAERVATTQVDVFGHSMGGLLSRLHVANARGDYRRTNNFQSGDVHKLVTVNTPHLGSPLANILVSLSFAYGQTFDDMMARMGFPVDQGAVFDLQTDSPEILNLPAVDLPVHAFVGTGGSDLIDLDLPLPGRAGTLWRAVQFFEDLIFGVGVEHDLIVSRPSQEGGLGAGSSQTSLFSFVPGLHMGGVTAAPEADARARELLDTPIGDTSSFAAGFPAGPGFLGGIAAGIPSVPQAVPESVAITQPAPGSSVAPGSTLVVTVQGVGGFVPARVLVVSPFDAQTVEAAPFSVSLDIPDQAGGPFEISAFAFDAADNPAASPAVGLQADVPASLVSLTPVPVGLSLFALSPPTLAAVVGNYSDGVDRPLNGAAQGTTYSSSDSCIADADADGFVSGGRIGSAQVAISNSGVGTSVDVEVVSALGDFDANGVIDDADFAVFNQAFGHSVGDPEYREEADFDDDGIVTLVDHQLFTAAMRSPCNPSPAGPQGCGLLGIEAALLVAAALARRRRRSGHA
jgi:probable HAF family extracellular repeat protein